MRRLSPRTRITRITPGALAAFATLAAFLVPAIAFADGSDTGAFQRALAKGPFVAMGATYVAGVAASLTPCVYPMIAITVAIFGASQAKSRWQAAALSGVFVLGIVALFAPLGALSAASGKGFGSALGNPWVVGGIALVFLTLAASMFGAFEMALPQSLQQKLSGVGGVGYKGAFVLGLVSALVAAPCTGPFLTGIGVYIATQQSLVFGTLVMSAFALGLGTLFFVVGTFAIALPKAGAWMMGIKWVSGVVLAYMALSFIRDILPKGVVAALAHPGTAYGVVAAIIFATGLVLGGTHIAAERRKSKIAHLSKPTKLASILPAIGGAFMLVTWLSLPKSTLIPLASATTAGITAEPAAPIAWETDEAAARSRAGTEHKPVVIDFGANWCKACKELEHETFPDARVRAEAARFVAISVDATDDEDPKVDALRKKYGLLGGGLPVVILLDAAGVERARFTEFVSPEKFAGALAAVR
jgi:thiol:disulfide interchange protein DsbD